jgi:hypothetical protein
VANLRRNSVRHILRDITQETAGNNSTRAERDAGELHVPQALCVSPPGADNCSLNYLRHDSVDTRDILGSRQKSFREQFRVLQRQTCLDREIHRRRLEALV